MEYTDSRSAYKLSLKINDQMTGVLLFMNSLFIQPLNREVISVNRRYSNYRGYSKL